jgi:hypothetical protein
MKWFKFLLVCTKVPKVKEVIEQVKEEVKEVQEEVKEVQEVIEQVEALVLEQDNIQMTNVSENRV